MYLVQLTVRTSQRLSLPLYVVMSRPTSTSLELYSTLVNQRIRQATPVRHQLYISS